MAYCIPRQNIEKMKKIFADLGDNQMSKITNMSDKERVDFFKKVLPEDEAVLLNREFKKSVASQKLTALKDWVNKNLNEKYRDEKLQKDISYLERNFKNLKEVDDFIEQRVDLLAEQSVGIGLTTKEIENFSKLGENLYNNAKYLNEGLINNPDGMFKFGKALKEMQDFTESLMPVNKWQAYVQNIGRVNMLASIKTPFLNIESNTITGLTEAIGRRVFNWKAYSSVDSEVAKNYSEMARKLFKDTGVDLSRMITVEDTVTGAGKIVGETTSRTGSKVLNAYSDFIFNKTLTTPDVYFGNFAFVDSAGITASRLAKNDKKLATEIFKDATLLNPKTELGKITRTEAIASARRATYTDDSWSSEFALGVRRILNNVPGLGDVLMPFVKTVANVAELGADYAGVGFVKGAVKGTRLGISKVKNGVIDRGAVISAFNDIVRSGIGLTAAYLIVNQIDVDDFMGAYDPARTGIDQLSNTAYNAIRVQLPWGAKWISLDYLGALAPSVVGMLYAKKYGEKELNQGVGYLAGIASQYRAQMPVFDPLDSFSGEIADFDPENKEAIFKIFGDKIVRGLTDIVAARMIPGITYDFARATDEYQRDVRQGVFELGGVNWDKFAQKIPYLRKNLPVKYDGLGRLMYEEGFETFLFGARARTDASDEIIKEIYRLRDIGEKPNVKDLRFSYSEKVIELKDKVGEEEFYDVARTFGEKVAEVYGKTMNTEKYKEASDEEKKRLLKSVVDDEYKKLLKKYQIKP